MQTGVETPRFSEAENWRRWQSLKDLISALYRIDGEPLNEGEDSVKKCQDAPRDWREVRLFFRLNRSTQSYPGPWTEQIQFCTFGLQNSTHASYSTRVKDPFAT